MHDDASRLLLQMKMLDQGIVPYTRDSRHRDVPGGLSSLTPKARRKAKRKFRKLWRKAAKRVGDLEALTSPHAKPTAWKRSGRGSLVLHYVVNDEL